MSIYVVNIKPGQEDRVAFHLAQKGIATYFPKTEGWVYQGLKKVSRKKALFSDYLFAWCEKNKVAQLCWTTVVKKVLWENSAPHPVPESLVAAIRSLEQEDGLVHPPRNYNVNDLLMIKAGPFKDLCGLFDHWESDSERVCVLLRLLNAQIKVSVPAALVEAAQSLHRPHHASYMVSTPTTPYAPPLSGIVSMPCRAEPTLSFCPNAQRLMSIIVSPFAFNV